MWQLTFVGAVVPCSVVCVPVALVAFSVGSTILVDGEATLASVVACGTCFPVSHVVCSFWLGDLTAKAKSSSGILSMVTRGMFFVRALIWLSSEFCLYVLLFKEEESPPCP